MSRRPVPPPPLGDAAQSVASPTPESEASQPGTGGASPAVRAQLLATEHWSLLATRSTAQSEVLSRVTMFLMLVSASIVGLALIGQVTRFGGRFITFALVLLGMVASIGTLTQMRVGNASIEDLAHVIGMNRLRAAYVELDPAIERYLVTSAHDDHNGLWQTYNHLEGPNPTLQPLASSGAFIAFVNAGLTGVFAALVAVALDAPGPLVGVAAAVCGCGRQLGCRNVQASPDSRTALAAVTSPLRWPQPGRPTQRSARRRPRAPAPVAPAAR